MAESDFNQNINTNRYRASRTPGFTSRDLSSTSGSFGQAGSGNSSTPAKPSTGLRNAFVYQSGVNRGGNSNEENDAGGGTGGTGGFGGNTDHTSNDGDDRDTRGASSGPDFSRSGGTSSTDPHDEEFEREEDKSSSGGKVGSAIGAVAGGLAGMFGGGGPIGGYSGAKTGSEIGQRIGEFFDPPASPANVDMKATEPDSFVDDINGTDPDNGGDPFGGGDQNTNNSGYRDAARSMREAGVNNIGGDFGGRNENNDGGGDPGGRDGRDSGTDGAGGGMGGNVYHSGGLTSDGNPATQGAEFDAKLLEDEFVINQGATQMYGKAFLDMINNGRLDPQLVDLLMRAATNPGNSGLRNVHASQSIQ